MARVTVEDCLRKEPNRFALVHLASRRSKQILKGSHPLINKDNKEVVLSLREIAAGKVEFTESSSMSVKAESELATITSMSADVKLKRTSGEAYTVNLSDSEDVE